MRLQMQSCSSAPEIQGELKSKMDFWGVYPLFRYQFTIPQECTGMNYPIVPIFRITVCGLPYLEAF